MPGSRPAPTRRITESLPAVSVLILTVHDHEDFLFQALQTGALGYILKTATINGLTDAIRTMHAKDVFIYPRMATKLVGNYLKRVGTNGRQGGYDRLSTREREILPLVAESHTNQEIADVLHLSPYTVQTYRQRITGSVSVSYLFEP